MTYWESVFDWLGSTRPSLGEERGSLIFPRISLIVFFPAGSGNNLTFFSIFRQLIFVLDAW
jgi:hypothetical protein